MPVNLSIKNAPENVVQRLRERAARNHRSLQGELTAIIEEAVKPEPAHSLTADEILARARALKLLRTDASAALIRADRDGGHRDQGH